MIFTGNVRIGNDPAVRYTANGDAVLDLSLAYDYGKKGEDGKRPTQWLNASLWGPRAEKMAPYLTKGLLVFVSCSDVHLSSYDQKDGTKRHIIRARIDVIEFVAGAKSDPKSEAKPEAKPQAKAAAKGDHFGDLDSDIPF